jgi:hypothetical protein
VTFYTADRETGRTSGRCAELAEFFGNQGSNNGAAAARKSAWDWWVCRQSLVELKEIAPGSDYGLCNGAQF